MILLDQELEEFLKGTNIYMNSIYTDGTIRWISKTLLEKLGYTLGEVIDKESRLLFQNPSSADKLLRNIFIKKEKIVEFPVKLKGKNGRIFSMKLSSMYQDNGYSNCFFMESTEERNFQELIFILMNLFNDGIIIFRVMNDQDPGELVIEFVNKTANRISGGSITKFIGKTLRESFPNFIDTGFPQKYIDCYKTGVSADLGEIEYGDDTVKTQIFKVECIPLSSERIVIHYYSLTIKQQIKESLLKSISQSQMNVINEESVQKTARNILNEIIKLTDSKIGYVAELRLNEETGKEYLDYICESGESSGYGIVFDVALKENKKGVPFICEDINPELYSFMALPLLFHGTCIGQLGVANADNGYDISIATEMDPLLIACTSIISSYALTKKEEDLHKQINIEIEKKKIAEEIARAKDTFLANMSHELKTLLNGIVGMSQLMMDTEMNLTQTDYANTIHQCSIQLLAIINDILDFSKMEAGCVSINREPFDLRECVEDAYDVIALKASKKDLNISYFLEQNVPTFVIGDKARLKQVLINLLENAVKFTEKGEIYTYIEADKEPDNGTYILKFSIHDTGIGIEDNKKDMIFDIFTQANVDVTTKKYPGTGLGLPICRHLVELMGGELWMDSVYGKGSVFHFTVLIEENHDISDYIESNDPILVDKKILIVDDNTTNRTIICSTVIKWKMQPTMCGSAEEALIYIRSGYVFDIGILDIQMPGISGITLAREIKKVNKEIPLIASSSIGQNCDVRMDLFVGILNKPIRDSRLYNMLVNILKPTIKIKYDKDTHNKYKKTRVLLAEDVVFNQKVAIGFLDKLGYNCVDVVNNGVKIVEKIKKNKYDVVLVDLVMEPMDGFQATREITRLIPEKDNRPFIVAMTAQTTDMIKKRCYEAGMDGFIGKPIILKELDTMLDIIEKNITKRKEKSAN